MADEARELLKRLVACEDDSECPWEFRAQAFADTRALLAREEDGPVAEANVMFVEDAPGEWYFVANGFTGRGLLGRLPVPAHVWNPQPIVGSVVENQEGSDGR